jgi:SulP family sulfate permease
LRESGGAIQVYRLSGYIFVGSSEGMFARIKADIEMLHRRQIAYLILDFRLVTGVEASAIVSLGKLRRFCKERNAILVLCSLSPANCAALQRGGFLERKNLQQILSDLNSALAWCEDEVSPRPSSRLASLWTPSTRGSSVNSAAAADPPI